MIKAARIVFLISLIAIFFFLFRCGKSNSDEPKEMSINIYMVALEGSTLQGKTIGCNDILVPISKTVLIEKNKVESAVSELFAAKSRDELQNYIKGPGLFLYQATLSNGKAEVYIKGDFNISEACDIPRIREQLYETVKQFSDVKEVKFFINAQSLESYLSIAGQGFN
jgi:hypothetical protein